VRVEIPPGNLRIPVTEFALVWNAVEDRVREDPSSRYFAGAAAACRWLAAYEDARTPITDEPIPADPETIRGQQVVADDTAYGLTLADPRVQQQWAMGVSRVLGWAVSALADPPVVLARKVS
jgi:hypothetical protein